MSIKGFAVPTEADGITNSFLKFLRNFIENSSIDLWDVQKNDGKLEENSPKHMDVSVHGFSLPHPRRRCLHENGPEKWQSSIMDQFLTVYNDEISRKIRRKHQNHSHKDAQYTEGVLRVFHLLCILQFPTENSQKFRRNFRENSHLLCILSLSFI